MKRGIILASFLLFLPFVSRGAVFYFLPSTSEIYLGDSFLVEVRLDTEGSDINAVDAKIEFPEGSFEVLDLSRGGSFISLWVEEPTFSISGARFTGGLPNGFKGDGLIGTMILRPILLGEFHFSFLENSQALLNDGSGSEAEKVFLDASYVVREKPTGLPVITSSTHPNQNQWFNSSTVHLHWDPEEGAEYSFLLSQDPSAIPDEIPDKMGGDLEWIGDIEYPDLSDGIYYFFLRKRSLSGEWLPRVSYRLMIDSTDPELSEVLIGKDQSLFQGEYFVSFNAIDKSSGIDHYEIKESKEGVWKFSESPYRLSDQRLISTITIKAVDKAGNETLREIPPQKKQLSWYWFLLVIPLVFAFILVLKRKRK